MHGHGTRLSGHKTHTKRSVAECDTTMTATDGDLLVAGSPFFFYELKSFAQPHSTAVRPGASLPLLAPALVPLHVQSISGRSF